MATHVYANGNEIASKSADGKARAQGDVCHTPPPAAAGPFPPGVPTMYPNTCLASDITNGSRTVFIVGKEIALEKKSYFKTSYGDEPATKGLAKGVISGAVQGRGYFQTWSPDVKVEGLSVTRHNDKVSHNHKNPTNTGLFPYLSRHWLTGGHDCKKEEERIEKACKKEKEEKDPEKQRLKPSRKRRFNLKRKPPKSGPTKKNDSDWHWTDDHCDGLELKPSLTAAQDMLAEAEKGIQELNVEQALVDAAKNKLYDFIQDAIVKGSAKLAAKALGKQALGSWVPLIGNIAMGAWSAYDAWSLYEDIDQLQELYEEVTDYVGTLKDKLGDLNKLLDRYKTEGASEGLMADVMDALANINRCTRYRKCNLVPYRNKYGGGKVEPADKGGCCPGQTGHHLVPDALTKNGACPGYNKRDAPTVCVEGKGHDHGSHKRVHDANDKMLGIFANKAGEVSMQGAIDAAVASHTAAFPLSKCDPYCIKMQLEAYYMDKCPNAKLKALDKDGKVVKGDLVDAEELIAE